jgi:hypothetical protein
MRACLSQSLPRGPGALVLSFASNPDPARPTANGTIRAASAADQDEITLARLSRANVAHADLASWLLAKEIGAEANASDQSAAAERVCQKLSQRLSRLFSPAGSQAILSRALHLARAEFAFFEGVHAGTSPEACLVGLSEHARDLEADDAGKGLVAVLGHLLDLLVGFIGEDLTFRLVREVWPDLPLLAPERSSNADGQEATS